MHYNLFHINFCWFILFFLVFSIGNYILCQRIRERVYQSCTGLLL